MSYQPEALRLADAALDKEKRDPSWCINVRDELRRQHREIEYLRFVHGTDQRLRADAERYRLLKSRIENYDGHACFPEIPYPAPIPDCSPFDAIDAAVDGFFKQAALRREDV